MQALLELSPLAAFFVAYRLGGIYAATAALMAAMLALVLIDWLRLRRVPAPHAISAALIWTLGAATLLLHDPRFLKWKPTLFLWLFALAAVASTRIGRLPLAQRLLGPMIARSEQLPRATWLALNWVWAAFYAVLGGLNLWIAYGLSERAWVDFKVFGLTAAFAAFALAQSAWLVNRTGALAESAS